MRVVLVVLLYLVELASAQGRSNLIKQQDYETKYNIYHPLLENMGKVGPYVKRPDLGNRPSIPPPQCSVDRVVSLARHGERYPEALKYKMMQATIQKLKHFNLRGPLEFIHGYEFFMSAEQAGQLSRTGVFSGSDSAERLGRQFREKYGHLIYGPDNGPSSGRLSDRKLNIYAGSTPRIVDTARYFAQGLFEEGNSSFSSPTWKNHAKIVKIPENPSRGANSLSPIMSCITPDNVINGLKYTGIYYRRVLDPVVKRLKHYAGNELLLHKDIDMLFNMCAFELNILGESKFCEIFTLEEWKYFEYDNDLLSYYSTGPGSPYSGAVGSVFAAAAVKLLQQAGSEQKVFASFAHDIDIQAVVTTLELFTPLQPLPAAFAPSGSQNPWKTSQITPMAARMIFERLSCGANEAGYIRVLVNDAVVHLPACHSGPGGSCPLEEFQKYVDDRLENYAKTCNLPPGLPRSLTFFWDGKN